MELPPELPAEPSAEAPPIDYRKSAREFARDHGLRAARLLGRSLLELLSTHASLRNVNSLPRLRQIDEAYKQGLLAFDALTIAVFDGTTAGGMQELRAGEEHSGNVVALRPRKKGSAR